MAVDVALLRQIASSPRSRPVAPPQNFKVLVQGVEAYKNAGILPTDQLEVAKAKLLKSIEAIQQSDAPDGYKRGAGSNAPGKSPSNENMLEKALNVLQKPGVITRSTIAGMIDPKRNLFRDVRDNTSTTDLLGKADWFKDLPAPVKIALGFAGDIATDPLTYLAPQTAITKAGGAAGVAAELAPKALLGFKEATALNAAGDAAGAAAKLAEANLAQDLAGRLVMKGKGGIGGLSNAELKAAGELLGQDFRGGLYFNVPGTGRIAQTLKGWAGLPQGEATQIFLGRNAAMRGASRSLSRAADYAKLSYPARAIGDKFKGGEGPIKRVIANSASPADAVSNLVFRNTWRQANAVGGRYFNVLAEELQSILDTAEKAGVDGTALYRALGGNRGARAAVEAAGGPELMGRLEKWRDDLRVLSDQFGRDALTARGADPDLMGQIVPNARKDWQPPLRTDEAATDMAASGARRHAQATFTSAEKAEHVAGGEYLGTRLADPNERVFRMASVEPRGRQVDGFEQMGHQTRTIATVSELELLADPQYAARIARGERIEDVARDELRLRAGQSLRGTPEVKLSKQDVMGDPRLRKRVDAGKPWREVAKEEADARRLNAAKADDTSMLLTEDSYRVFRDGKYETVPESKVVYEDVPADPLGRSVREQINAVNMEKFGYELFVEDMSAAGRKILNDFTRAHISEVHGALLRHFGLGEALDIPGSVRTANRKIAKAVGEVNKAAKAAAKSGDKVLQRQAARLAAEAEGADRLQLVIEETADDLARLAAGSPEARRLEGELTQLVEEHALLTDNLMSMAEELAPDNAAIKMMRRQIQGERSKGAQSILGQPEVPVAAMTSADLGAHASELNSQLQTARMAGDDLVRELDNARRYEEVARQVGPMTRRQVIELRAAYRALAAAEADEIRGVFERLGADSFTGFPTKATRGPLKGEWVFNGRLLQGGEWDWFTRLDRGTQDAMRRRMVGKFYKDERALGEVFTDNVDDVVGEFAVLMGLDSTNPGEAEDLFVEMFQRLRTAEAHAKPNSDLRNSFAPLAAEDLFRTEYGITPEKLFSGYVDDADFLRSLNEDQVFHYAEAQSGLDAPQMSVKELEAELKQLDIDTKNLQNRLQDVEAETARRAQIHDDIDAFNADPANDIALEVRMAHGAVDADPSTAPVVTKALKGLADEMPKLPTPPPFVVMTAENMGSRVANARARVDAMEKLLQERLARIGSLSAEQQRQLDDAARIRTNIDRIEQEIARSDAEFRATDVDGNLAKLRLERTEQDVAATIVNKREALMAALEGEARDADRLWNKIDNLKYQEFLYSDQGVNAVRSLVREHWTAIGRHTQVPDWHMAEAIAAITKMDDPQFTSKILKYFDKLTRLFKSWAVTTPGFIARNGYSGMWMNYMLNVSPGSYRAWLAADRAYLKALNAGMDAEQALLQVAERHREAYRLVRDSGVLDQGSQMSSVRSGLNRLTDGKPTNVIDRLADTPLNRLAGYGNREMERVLRGAAAMDAAINTKSVDRIYDIVYKAHFDYNDINAAERIAAVRAMPFYIYFRKALPAMIEGLFTNPKAFARVAQFKSAVESVTPPEDLVPTWMRERMSIRLPFALGGGQNYLMPDLPVHTLTMLTNPREVLGAVNPLIKMPLELRYNSKVYFGDSSPFQGLVQAPWWMTKTGLHRVLEAAGFAKRSTDGKLLVDDKVLYAMEQTMPLLGRARRLAPTEERYQDRMATTYLNFLFGASMRTNTESDQRGEVYFRQKKLDAMADELNTLGYGGYQKWTKQVVTRRKPTANDKRPYLTLIAPKGGLGADSPYGNVSMGNRKSAAEVLAELGASGQLQSITASARGTAR